MLEVKLDPIAPTALLADRVADAIRDAIITGKLAPNTRLVEPALAEQLAVSTSPIREALARLVQEGLVVAEPRRGKLVRAFEQADVKEIFEMRAALECLACELVVESRQKGAGDFNYLQECIEAQKLAIEDRNYVLLTDLDLGFHESICRKSGSKLLLSTWRSLRSQVKVLFYWRLERFGEAVIRTPVSDHARILEALRRNDSDSLCRITKEYCNRATKEILHLYKE